MPAKPAHLLQLVLLISTIIINIPGNALVTVASNTPPVLIAAKGNKVKGYKSGEFLRITYKLSDDKYYKISGRLIKASGDSIEIESRRGISSVHIATKDITSVSKLHKAGRTGWVQLMSFFVLLTIAGILYIESMAALLFLAIPVIALYTYVPFLFFSFMSDILSKKSVSKGWGFYTE